MTDLHPDSDDDVFAFPASFAEQRLWFLDQVDPFTAVYNVAQGLLLEGPVQLPVLARAIQLVVDRHEALRTTFSSQEGAPLQVVAPALAVPLEVVDLRDRPEAEREGEARRLANAEARTPFDLSRGPLIRALALVLGPERHLLVLNAHHIICDGWSLALLFRELSELYPAFLAGRPSPLPEVTTQYADYAMWQREWFEGEELARELAFWTPLLSGPLPVLELPGDRTRPQIQSFTGGSLRFLMSPQLTAGIAALARQEGASGFMVLLAAFNLLLRRLSGQEEILLGTPIANRDRAEIETSIGFYTNTVVFRTDLSAPAGAPPLTFRALLARVRKMAMEVLAHQDVPLEKVVEAVHPARATSHNPIFQAMFGLQKAPPESALELPGVTITAVDVHSGTSKFDLTLDMQETGDAMQGVLEYSADLFDPETAERLARHYLTLLESIVAAPDQTITALPLLSAADRRLLLEEWNATTAPYPAGSCLHELIAAQAARTPDATAVEHDGAALSYAELDRRSSLLAAHLRELGVRPDVLVAVAMDRSLDLLVALLGVLKAGGAYLPIDPAYPQDRIAYMLADAGTPVVITQAHLQADLPLEGSAARVVAIDADWPRIAQAGPLPVPAEVGPDHRAYVIYTSGSTGKPKGVEIPHRAVVNFVTTMAREPGLSAADRLLAVTTLSFDIAGLELYLPLTVGATVVLASRDTASDGRALLDALTSTRATVIQATPATFRMLLEAGWEPARRPLHDSLSDTPAETGVNDSLSDTPAETGVRILCGGEAMPADLAGPLLERAAELWNMYGPTETTIWSTCARVQEGEAITIGRPIANTRIYVLDEALAPVPLGVAGDLYIAGDGVARGYLNRPELTAERFVPDPFAAEPGRRMYKTGDQARYLRDGNLVFLGRGDTQVKVRGFRIELGEIETVLAQHEDLRQAVVVVRGDASGDARIVAYVVHQAGASPTPSELRKHLRRSLPDHMIPHFFIELAQVPLTQNGKVDRRALPDPFTQDRRAVAEAAAAVPQSTIEKAVAEIWRDTLKVGQVGLHDNFFDLGGHSLLSMQVIHRIAGATGHRLNPRSMVFLNLEQIAAECERGAAGA